MSNARVYVDFHVIQTVPPSCVNRDDTGSPKTAVYGGVPRARVSSQSWKHAMRVAFNESFDESALGVRSKKIITLLQEKIQEICPDINEEKALGLAEKVISSLGIKIKTPEKEKKPEDGSDVKTKEKDKEKKLSALFFMSKKQAENLAALAAEDNFDKKTLKEALRADTSVDIALFGRMVADDPSLNEDASAQVAHAISTHRVDNEFDYFTAVDDLSPADNAGAGMIGTVEFNSSTLYRYATVAAHELFIQLANNAEAAAKTVAEFANAFITSMPTGKQNTFANRTLPDGVVVTIRSDQPINFAGAFETPVSGKDGGFVNDSKRNLVKYSAQVNKDYFGVPEKGWTIGEGLDEMGARVSLSVLLESLEKELSGRLAELQ
jgi:CRISPR system Cascade subunit CasC